MLKRLFGVSKPAEDSASSENKKPQQNGKVTNSPSAGAENRAVSSVENTTRSSQYPDRIAAVRAGLNESSSRVALKSDITKSISSTKLASVFFQKNDFLDNGVSAQGYVMDFVACAGDIIADVESLEGDGFPADRFFSVLLDSYRRVPKLCLETIWLLLNVETFLGRVSDWPEEKRALLRLRALTASMGKGILAANHLIKSEILRTRDGSGRLHEGPLFKDLNTLFKEKGETYNERLRLALRMSWAFAYAEMAKAGIPDKYRINLDAVDDVTSFLKIIIADTAMERHPYGPNKRRQTLSVEERIPEIVKYAGRGLMFDKSSVIEWLKTRDKLSSIDFVYLPTENATIEKEGLGEYALTLFDCVSAFFPSISRVDSSSFAEALRKLLTAHFSVKKKFTMKLAPSNDGVSIKTFDYDGTTMIREINIPAGSLGVFKNEPAQVKPSLAAPAPEQPRPAPGLAPAATVAPDEPAMRVRPIPQDSKPAAKKRLDLDLG